MIQTRKMENMSEYEESLIMDFEKSHSNEEVLQEFLSRMTKDQIVEYCTENMEDLTDTVEFDDFKKLMAQDWARDVLEKYEGL